MDRILALWAQLDKTQKAQSTAGPRTYDIEKINFGKTLSTAAIWSRFNLMTGKQSEFKEWLIAIPSLGQFLMRSRTVKIAIAWLVFFSTELVIADKRKWFVVAPIGGLKPIEEEMNRLSIIEDHVIKLLLLSLVFAGLLAIIWPKPNNSRRSATEGS